MINREEIENKLENYETTVSSKDSILVRYNNAYLELDEEHNSDITGVSVFTEDPSGNRAYERTLCLILIASAKKIIPNYKLRIEYSISKGLFCTLMGRNEVTKEEIVKLKNEMERIVKENLTIEKIVADKEKAVEIFMAEEDYEKVNLIKQTDFKEYKIYKLMDTYGYFYGPMGKTTGNIRYFNLAKYKDGFVLLYPTLEEPLKVPEFKHLDKLYEIFQETGEWDRIIGVHSLSTLNEKIVLGEGKRLISIAEGLHEKKYVNIANEIKERKNIKIVLLSGPSSSGKTTSSKRLAVQLMVNGLKTFPIEMDNYFVNRADTPKLPDGSFDFESLRALDVELFNQDMEKLISGETITMPKFNFVSGEREAGKKLRIPDNGILIIEGIHALNPEILKNIKDKYKFKIYVSALTQLNLDNHNRISTTDVRKLRRMVRDHARRGYSAEDTLTMFKGVIRGEKNYVYPFQEEADTMFNSTIVYEIPVLKKHALPLLDTINEDSPVYDEAVRLKHMLNFVMDMEDDFVPPNSVLREFIGGSFFD